MRHNQPLRRLTGRKVKAATSARAIFQAGGDSMPKVVFSFLTDSEEQFDFELTIHQTASLIEQSMAAYNAIIPPLKTSRGGFGL